MSHGSSYSVALCREAGIDPYVKIGTHEPWRMAKIERVPFDVAAYIAATTPDEATT